MNFILEKEFGEYPYVPLKKPLLNVKIDLLDFFMF